MLQAYHGRVLGYTVFMMNQGACNNDVKACPIGVFDSGVGGFTVVREIMDVLPGESILYFGDTLRCPYGPRPLEEIRGFARQISRWLAGRGVKLIVIACNSATAAGLESVQLESEVPVIGVVAPGARAAVQATRVGRVGVIGTLATIESGVYTQAIRSLDAGITTFSAATPRFVEMVEQGLRLDNNPIEDIVADVSSIYIRPAFLEIAREYLQPLKACKIDTLVLGCTHYPLLTPLISQVMGADVRIISSAKETARDVAEVLGSRDQLAEGGSAGGVVDEGSAGGVAGGNSGGIAGGVVDGVAEGSSGSMAGDAVGGVAEGSSGSMAGGMAGDGSGGVAGDAARSAAGRHCFVTTAEDVDEFAALGAAILGGREVRAQSVSLEELGEL